MNYDIESVNSTYSGQLFKSKLEARWAYMFDKFGWDWSYEPMKINGKVPDFILKGKPSNVIVEVKPKIFITKPWIQELFDSYYESGMKLLILHDKPFKAGKYDIMSLGLGWQYINNELDELKWNLDTWDENDPFDLRPPDYKKENDPDFIETQCNYDRIKNGDYAAIRGHGEPRFDIDAVDHISTVTHNEYIAHIINWEMKYKPYDFGSAYMAYDGSLFDVIETRKNFITEYDSHEFSKINSWWLSAEHVTGIRKYSKQ